MGVTRILTDKAYSSYEAMVEKEVRGGQIPGHIAIIMDGNRRYAEEVLGAEPMEGHRLGREKLEEVLHWCIGLGVKVLTVYAFSTENFNRDPTEVDYLMDLLEKSLYDFADDDRVHENKVCIKVIGDTELLPESIVKAAEYATARTNMYSDRQLNMAIAYGGRQDITNAVRRIAQEAVDGTIEVSDINENMISCYISTYGVPDPDLVLRTSGEVRISNFLLWQMAYSELYFTDVYWPGFRYIDLLRAIRTFQQRKRRFGK